MKPESTDDTSHPAAADEHTDASDDAALREEEKLRSLGQLAAGVAHDFNNSLTAILGRVQLLMRRTTDERQMRDLQIIETAALDAAGAVRRIQTFARRGDTPEHLHTIAASRLVSDVIQLTRTRWETDALASGLSFEVEFTPAPEGADEVSANPSEVREVLVNLVFNALDAMPGGGRLQLLVEGADEFVRIVVRDTGRGIPADVIGHIFRPFFTTKGARGSGLGLAVSRSIVEKHDGAIEVESEMERGTTFRILLPRVRVPRPKHDAGANALPARRVLVVDDEELVRDVLVEMLRELGQDVTEAGGGDEALERLARESFDLMLTDLSMPGVDGLTLAARARRLAPGMRIVLATGYGQDTPGGLPPDASLVDDVVSKPFRFSDLETLLRAPHTRET
ncbi:MAG: ATP-binding protein [Pyrinomonadaceae bacterium]